MVVGVSQGKNFGFDNVSLLNPKFRVRIFNYRKHRVELMAW